MELSAEEIRSWSGYRNCVRNRRKGAKICRDCPFRKIVEATE